MTSDNVMLLFGFKLAEQGHGSISYGTQFVEVTVQAGLGSLYCHVKACHHHLAASLSGIKFMLRN